MSDLPFGKYLAVVQERDVDLLLMEEFHVDPGFAQWWANELGIPAAAFDGAWHSVTDADGETDLLLRLQLPNGERLAVLIENKIAASEQDRQAERYHLRAARAQAAGHADRVMTCMVAPATYLAGIGTGFGYDAALSYEAVAAWFASRDDRRSRWRHAVMLEAIAQSRRGYNMIVNAAVSQFHLDFWTHLTRHHRDLVMRRPTPKGSGSSWIRLKGAGFPLRTEIALKLDRRIVELSFLGRRIEELLDLDMVWPPDVVLSQKGKTAAVQLPIPVLDKRGPLANQQAAVEETITITRRLLPYAGLLAPQPL